MAGAGLRRRRPLLLALTRACTLICCGGIHSESPARVLAAGGLGTGLPAGDVDPTLARHHVPRLRGLEADELHTQLAAVVLPYAARAWADLQHPDQGVVHFDHDHYLKIWALSEPKIPADFLLLDEAQDTNPVVEQVFTAQRAHAQLVMVGDSAQAIYGWRGARDVMHTTPR